jgi:Prokaryotic E2 family E
MTAKDILEKHAEELAAQTGLKVDVVERDNQLFVVIHNYKLPAGVARVERTAILFIADLQYPLSAMDMFWTDLEVVRPDGSLFEGADNIAAYLERQWRRFSYHRNDIWSKDGNPLLDHFAFMETRWTPKAEARR